MIRVVISGLSGETYDQLVIPVMGERIGDSGTSSVHKLPLVDIIHRTVGEELEISDTLNVENQDVGWIRDD